MSGAINLEGDGPATIVGPSPAPEPVQAPAPAPEPVVDDEADLPEAVTDATGRKLVPLDALKATRQELKAAKQLASAAEQLREAAQRGEQLGQFFQTIEAASDENQRAPVAGEVSGESGTDARRGSGYEGLRF